MSYLGHRTYPAVGFASIIFIALCAGLVGPFSAMAQEKRGLGDRLQYLQTMESLIDTELKRSAKGTDKTILRDQALKQEGMANSAWMRNVLQEAVKSHAKAKSARTPEMRAYWEKNARLKADTGERLVKHFLGPNAGYRRPDPADKKVIEHAQKTGREHQKVMKDLVDAWSLEEIRRSRDSKGHLKPDVEFIQAMRRKHKQFATAVSEVSRSLDKAHASRSVDEAKFWLDNVKIHSRKVKRLEADILNGVPEKGARPRIERYLKERRKRQESERRAKPKLKPMPGFSSGILHQMDLADEWLEERVESTDPKALLRKAKAVIGPGRAGAGGVSLHAPVVMLTPLKRKDIRGAKVEKDHLVLLYGNRRIAFPPMDPDYLALALRVIYGGQGLVKGKLLAEESNAVVIQTGKEQFGDVVWRKEFLPSTWPDPAPGDTVEVALGPGIGILAEAAPSTDRVTYYGSLQNTRMGKVLLEADMLLHTFLTGVDLKTGLPVPPPNVDGYMTLRERTVRREFAKPKKPTRKNEDDKRWWRGAVWLVWAPDRFTLKLARDGISFEFVDTRMKLDAWSAGQDTIEAEYEQLAKHSTRHYQGLAKSFPVLKDLEEVAKAVCVVRWLKKEKIPVDLAWANAHAVKRVQTPSTVRRLSVVLMGDAKGKPVIHAAAAPATVKVLDKGLEFHDTFKPPEVSTSGTEHYPAAKPWTDVEKRIVRLFFGEVRKHAPGLWARATVYRPIRLYRTTKRHSNRFAVVIPGVHALFVSDELADKFGKKESLAFSFQAVNHELAHLADPFDRISWSKEWVGLVKPRIDKVKEAFLKKQGITVAKFYAAKYFPEAQVKVINSLAGQQELPTGYASFNLREALAEYTAYAAFSTNNTAPKQIKAFIRSAMLTTPVRQDPATAHVHRGLTALEYGRRQEAVQAFGKAIKIDPGFARAYLYRADTWRALGQIDRAIVECTKAIDLGLYAEMNAYLERGRLYAMKDRSDQAIADFSTYLKESPDDANARTTRGLEWIKKGQADKALADFAEVIRRNPEAYKAYYNRALAWGLKQEHDKAIADIDVYLKHNPPYAPAYYARALAWVGKKDLDKAIADITQAIKLDPRDTAGYYNRGKLWLEKKKVDKAITDFSEVIRRDPQAYYARYNRAEAWRKKQEYDKAIADIDVYVKHEPPYAPAYYVRAMAWSGKKNLDKAIADLTQAIKLDPRYTVAYYSRALIWSNKRNPDKAIADFTEYLRQSPDDAKARIARGVEWRMKRQVDKGIADFSEAIRRDPRAYKAYYNRAEAWVEKQEYDKAIADIDVYLKHKPSHASAYYTRAEAWAGKKDFDKAIADLTQVLKLDPSFVMAYYKRSLVWRYKRDFDKAITDINKVIKRAPNWALAYHVRAELWESKKDFDRAIADYDAILKRDSKDLRAYYRRALIWDAKKAYGKAIADYRKTVSLNPKFAGAHLRLAILLATCPDGRYRDGAGAVKSATRACELSGWKHPTPLEILAAAHAEAGQFDKAVQYQTKALELTTDVQAKAKASKRLELYKARKPYRAK